LDKFEKTNKALLLISKYMLKIAKYAMIINMILSLFYVISDYVLWGIIGGESWSYYGAVTS